MVQAARRAAPVPLQVHAHRALLPGERELAPPLARAEPPERRAEDDVVHVRDEREAPEEGQLAEHDVLEERRGAPRAPGVVVVEVVVVKVRVVLVVVERRRPLVVVVRRVLGAVGPVVVEALDVDGQLQPQVPAEVAAARRQPEARRQALERRARRRALEAQVQAAGCANNKRKSRWQTWRKRAARIRDVSRTSRGRPK